MNLDNKFHYVYTAQQTDGAKNGMKLMKKYRQTYFKNGAIVLLNTLLTITVTERFLETIFLKDSNKMVPTKRSILVSVTVLFVCYVWLLIMFVYDAHKLHVF